MQPSKQCNSSTPGTHEHTCQGSIDRVRRFRSCRQWRQNSKRLFQAIKRWSHPSPQLCPIELFCMQNSSTYTISLAKTCLHACLRPQGHTFIFARTLEPFKECCWKEIISLRFFFYSQPKQVYYFNANLTVCPKSIRVAEYFSEKEQSMNATNMRRDGPVVQLSTRTI